MSLTPDQLARVAGHAKNAPMPGTTARPLVEDQPLHVDGDYMAYYCAGNDDTSAGEARTNALNKMLRAAEASGSGRIIVHLSDRNCDKGLRFFIAEARPYQGQRNTGRKPKNWEILREWLEGYDGNRFTVKNWRDREADDGMAYCAEQSYLIDRPGAVLTADKDMRMFAGLHMDWKTHQMVEIPPGTYDRVAFDKQFGHKWFWMQMIQGDTADNIPGVPRSGEKAAQDLLRGTASNAEAFERVLQLYKDKLGDHYPHYFVEQAGLLWMRTDIRADVLDFLRMHNAPEWGTDIIRAARLMKDRVEAQRDALRH